MPRLGDIRSRYSPTEKPIISCRLAAEPYGRMRSDAATATSDLPARLIAQNTRTMLLDLIAELLKAPRLALQGAYLIRSHRPNHRHSNLFDISPCRSRPTVELSLQRMTR